MIRIYRFQDAPERIKKLANMGGDEDYIIIGPANDRSLFQLVVDQIEKGCSNFGPAFWEENTAFPFQEDGQEMLLWTVTHA